jgi:hypothetical protein
LECGLSACDAQAGLPAPSRQAGGLTPLLPRQLITGRGRVAQVVEAASCRFTKRLEASSTLVRLRAGSSIWARRSQGLAPSPAAVRRKADCQREWQARSAPTNSGRQRIEAFEPNPCPRSSASCLWDGTGASRARSRPKGSLGTRESVRRRTRSTQGQGTVRSVFAFFGVFSRLSLPARRRATDSAWELAAKEPRERKDGKQFASSPSKTQMRCRIFHGLPLTTARVEVCLTCVWQCSRTTRSGRPASMNQTATISTGRYG